MYKCVSVAVHIASAWEIATEMQLAGGEGEAPSSDEEGGATACARTVICRAAPPRCAFVCVCVCLCVYSRVGASCVGRPICVCAPGQRLRLRK